MKNFTVEELLAMIEQRDLKPTLIVEVKQGDFSPYKIPVKSLEELEQEKELHNLTVLNQEYMLLTDEEEKQLLKDGNLSFL